MLRSHLPGRVQAAGLPQAKDLEARTLVVVTRYLWRAYAISALPAHVRPLAGLLETIITGIEAAYRLVVKSKR